LRNTGITSTRIITNPPHGPRSLIDQLPELMYTYSLPKTNEILFNTHILLIACYVHMYSVTLWFPL